MNDFIIVLIQHCINRPFKHALVGHSNTLCSVGRPTRHLASQSGLITWPVVKRTFQGVRTFTLVEDGAFEQIAIDSARLDECMAQLVDWVPAACLDARLGVNHDLLGGALVEKENSPAAFIKEYASTVAFKNLNIKYMAAFALHCELTLPRPKPVGEFAWAKFLMQQFLPSWAENDIDLCIEKYRGKQVKRSVVEAYAFCVEV